MSSIDYRHIITQSLDGLPPESLAEIADFALFVRRRATQPRQFDDDLRAVLQEIELSQLNRAETAHLETEFNDYARRFPRE